MYGEFGKEAHSMNVEFTANEKSAKVFNSFGTANAFGEEHLGVGFFEVSHKGGIRLKVTHPMNKGVLYVKE